LIWLEHIETQLAQIARWNETAAHQTEAGQNGQPFGVEHVGLATGHMLDEMGIDHPGRDARVLQVGVDALPVDAGALHDHELDLQLGKPGGQGAAVALEAAEVPTVLGYRAVGLLDQHGDHMQHAVHIDTGHAPVQGGKTFHDDAPLGKVQGGTQERHPWSASHWAAKADQQRADELKDSSNRNRFGPLYRTCCRQTHSKGRGSATVGGTSQLGAGPVRHRGRAFIRIATFSHLRATSYGAIKLGFHARGRVGQLMIG
jgi:hypothetical protein